jgi:hypothetical protein
MRRPWRRRAQLIDPGLPPNLRILELQTAKEILAEVFHARPGEVEEMIQMRLEERSLGRAGGAPGGWSVAAGVLCGGVGIIANFYKNVIQLSVILQVTRT